ncbi:MAG: NACHT domain-containing protein [Cyanobacteria bacterium P01_H01_bin.105]
MSRTTITNFFSQKPVGESSFRKICFALRLNWKQVSSDDIALDSSNNQSAADLTQSNKTLIEKVGKQCRQKILARHSRMRLLSGVEIGVDQLYVDVWLLEKPENKYFINDVKTLLKTFDMEEDRLALSKRIKRNPGFEIANNNSKLVILGKPGSGKTTFLKHLAVDWCRGRFQPEQIAVLIELRKIREKTWKLINAISEELELKDEKKIKGLLEQGKLLVLMDGLDEVPTNELRYIVQDQIKQISEKYLDKNRLILTCRTQIMGIIPSGFTSVEVADFKPAQISKFVRNWFTASGKTEIEVTQQVDAIQLAIANQPDLKEVTATPVLLSLICIVWQDSGELPPNRANLYKQGINWLLRRWNNRKDIEGWEIGTEVYRQLSTDDKEALLMDLAARKFENPKNFVLFEQDELVEQINLTLELNNIQDGIAVLKAIEAQHGLLIERADELWSFSHLTFQEYFTVQRLTQLPPQQLAERVANYQWQNVVAQLIESQQPAHRFLYLIKQTIDQSVAKESDIQVFLNWLQQKTHSLQADSKPMAIRAFYYSLTLALARVRSFAPENFAKIVPEKAKALDPTLKSNPNISFDFDLCCILEHALNLYLDLALDRILNHVLNLHRAFEHILSRRASLIIALELSSHLFLCLRQFRDELPKTAHPKEIQRWWSLHGKQWLEEFRQVIVDYRNIGHDWQFTYEQRKQFQRYYEANIFLVRLMNIKGAVSEEYRTEIEDGLMLPWEELQQRQPHLYAELEG